MAQRQRLSSMSDHSSPSSDVSENSESFDVSDLPHDHLNLETSLSSEVTENERQQIESFFSGLGTEVGIINMANYLPLIGHKYKDECSLCSKGAVNIQLIVIKMLNGIPSKS